jgi:hypothetical protein
MGLFHALNFGGAEEKCDGLSPFTLPRNLVIH